MNQLAHMNPLVALREPDALPAAERSLPGEAPRQPGFHLLVESLADTAGSTVPSACDLPALQVPAGISHLAPAREPLALVSRKPRTPAFVFEPLAAREQQDGRPRLLLLTPAGLRARLNGQAVPRVALLRVGDQLQLDANAILHVTEYRLSGAVAPSPELVGEDCGVCRLPLLVDTTVYICVGCGLPMHLEGQAKPADDRLECALFGDCPVCGSKVRTESGHVWLPEL